MCNMRKQYRQALYPISVRRGGGGTGTGNQGKKKQKGGGGQETSIRWQAF